jgi:hypothetical protein
MKQIIKIKLMVLCCFFSVELMADERWYQIEVIIFSQNTQNTEVFEQTRSELSLPANLAFLSQSEYALPSLLQNPVAYARVKSEDRLLNGTYNKLQRNSNYQPLLYESWIQPARSNQVNKGVHLGVTGNYNEDLLNGILKIQRGHYLHLIMDMEYAPGQFTSTDKTAFSEPVIYHLKEKRRFRLNEVHYLDHPTFGIIVTIKPLEI